MLLPDFKIPIDDEAAAHFWLEEWDNRFQQTRDHAFKETADAMRRYMLLNFDPDEEVE